MLNHCKAAFVQLIMKFSHCLFLLLLPIFHFFLFFVAFSNTSRCQGKTALSGARTTGYLPHLTADLTTRENLLCSAF